MSEIMNSLKVLGIAIVIFLVAMYFLRILLSLTAFTEDLRYINMELHRCSSRMRPKWRRRRRRLWRRFLIPFYRW